MDQRTYRIRFFLLCAGFAAAAAVSVCMGRYELSPGEIADVIAGRKDGEMAAVVLLGNRLPRIAAAALIGCGLAVSGASYQGIFKNPMVSPDLLGASAGAGFGAALGFLLGLPTVWTEGLAFVSGMAAVFLTWNVGGFLRAERTASPLLLVLSGVMVSALFQAGISIIKYAADPFDTMPSIAFWLMGGLTYVTSADLPLLAAPVLLGTAVLLTLRWRMNLMAFGDEEAMSLGVPVYRYRGLVVLCATMMTAAGVAVGGMIGWVGLIIPHMARILVGADYRNLLPFCAVMGGGFLLLVDDAARCLFAQDLPIGILTAMIGAPLFLVLLKKEGMGD